MMKVRYFIADQNSRLVSLEKNAALELERCNANLMDCPIDEWDRYEPVYKLFEPEEENADGMTDLEKAKYVLIGAGACLLGMCIGMMLAALL